MRWFSVTMVFAWACLLAPGSLFAQASEGFNTKVQATTQGNERIRQSSLWMMEVHLKPLRLIWVDVKDPQTGEVKQELFYYLCYKAVNRPVPPLSESSSQPVNQNDPQPAPPYFIPEFTLVAENQQGQQVILDSIVPEALAAINQKERRQFKNSVTISGPLPAATDAEPDDSNSLFGVAIFRGVDPVYDRYTIYMSGFSNGYQVGEAPDGEPLTLRKTIRQRFWRPGDRFNPTSQEFTFDGEPEWIYRPDSGPVK